MKYYILYNPKAGNGSAQKKASELAEVYGAEAVCHDMTSLESYALFFEGLGEEDKVIVCGGDGTLNRFINDTEGIRGNREILYSAIGTGNDFLRDLGKDADSPPFPINEYINDLPTVAVNGETRRFLNNVGFGIDGYCCEVGDALKEKYEREHEKAKPINYTAIAIKGLLFGFKPTNADITVDGKSYHYKKVWIAPTMNGRFYGGGMMPTPHQDRSSGELSLMVFHGSGKLRTLSIFPSIFKGEHIKHEKAVTIIKGNNISVRFDRPAALQIDGETVLGVTEYSASCEIKAKV